VKVWKKKTTYVDTTQADFECNRIDPPPQVVCNPGLS